MSKCPGCPVAGACVAETPGWSFACRLAAEGTPADRAFVVNRSAMGAGLPAPTPPPRRAEAPAAPPRDWSAWRRAVRLGSLNCPYASKDSECGCSGFRCHHLGRLATAADCLECLSHTA